MIRILFSLLFLGISATATTQPTQPSSPARFAVHLLDYLAQDYAGAVQNGKILSKSEYQEQVEFAEQVTDTVKKLNLDFKQAELETFAQNLQTAINTKADAEKVRAIARNLQSKIIQYAGVEQKPTAWPNIKKGSQIFAQTCVSCHGETGAGNGILAKSLQPKPLNFFDPAKMNSLTAFQAFNAIRLGIPGTAMQANPTISDKDVWNLAFFVLSLRHANSPKSESNFDSNESNLEIASIKSDVEILKTATGTEAEKKYFLTALRTFTPAEDNMLSYIQFASANLDSAVKDYKEKSFGSAKKKALIAYLEGIEPVEPKLKAMDPKFTIELEEAMALIRSDLDQKVEFAKLDTDLLSVKNKLTEASSLLEKKSDSVWLTFSLAAGILFREGFEAVLLIIALLGVIRAANSKRAETWLHIGWTTAIAIGVICWFFSGWVASISGAGRELMEGVTSLLAVIILLYIGFWLHSRTEITRWKAFIDGKVQKALDGGNRIGIALIAFMTVFREAFETVLFLRAISLDDSKTSQLSLLAGVLTSFALVLLLGWLLLKYSSKIPIRKLFSVSSMLMIFLAVMLAGKAFHALQEAGLMSATVSPIPLRADLFGFYPTLETLLSQIIIGVIAVILWQIGKKSPPSQTT